MSISRVATFFVALLLTAAASASDPLSDLATIQNSRSRRISSNSTDAGSNSDNRRVKPGDTFTLADIKGSGVIRHIWLTFPESPPSWLSNVGVADPSEIVLRIYWDGAAEPAVECPLGDFFAAGFGRRAEVNSIPVIVGGAAGDAYNCYWAMPFHTAAKITVTNESVRPLASFYYQVDYTEEPTPETAAYFCAQYRQEFPTVKGHDYLIADIDAPQGGQYVGTVMSVRSRSPQWFGEGDEKFYIDGEELPSLWGTGTEDYFSNAWGMEKACYPYFGVTILDGWLGDLGDCGTMYRWHLSDPVRFKKSLKFEIEHAGWMSADETTTGKVEGFVEREDDFATVAFWYQRGQPKRFTTLPSAKDRKLPLIDTIIEGKTLLEHATAKGGPMSLQSGAPWTGAGQIFFNNTEQDGFIEFSFDVPEELRTRLVLSMTRSYDYGEYRILLDGKPITPSTETMDFWSRALDLKDVNLGDQTLSKGSHTIRMECVGRNLTSRGWKLGIDSVRLRHRWNVKRAPLNLKPQR